MDPKNKVFVTWEQVNSMVFNLASQINADKTRKIKAIIGIPRGGLIPAVMLSHELDIPLLTEEEWQVGDKGVGIDCEHILVIDDICDTGETLKDYINNGTIATAVLYQKHKDSSSVQATYHAVFLDYHELHNWIVFPWEKSEAATIQDYKKQPEIILGTDVSNMSDEDYKKFIDDNNLGGTE